jgi:mono/diheme cytochrome c family protein
MHIFAHVPGRWSWAPALLLGACGAGAPPQLPAQAPTPRTAVAAASPATPAALRDRTLGTTGYACVDCHGLGEPGHRPGPDLAGVSARTGLWSGTAETLPVAVNRCVERWLARPSLDAGALGGVVAALAALPAGASAPSASGAADATDATELPEGDAVRGAALYDAACRHCHEGGPAGPLWGRAWARPALIRTVRGADRPAHPGTLMPAFATSALTDAQLADLTTALADGAAPAL